MRFAGCAMLALSVCIVFMKASAPLTTSVTVAVIMGLIGGLGVWLVDQDSSLRQSRLEQRLEKLIAPYRARRI